MLSTAETLAPPATLDRALALAQDDMKAVNTLILNRVSNEIPLIRDVARHIVGSGGKRLRPLVMLIAARLSGYRGSRHIALAACVEFIHTATLLHDDVVDESALRRGFATANEVFGNKASVLVGDFLFTQAFQLMVADGSLATLSILSDAAAIISKGEVKQLMTEGDPETTREQYLDVIASKTAELFAAAGELGAVVADRTEYEVPLREYGYAIGMAFQLVDDALDYTADEAQLGKSVGDDFREGKVTLPVLIAYERGDAEERAFWLRTLQDGVQTGADFDEAVRLLQRHGALAETLAAAKGYCALAAEAIAEFPASEEKQALTDIIAFCAGRMY